MKGIIVFADGAYWLGDSFGADICQSSPVIGEAVFNTSMSGYQEIMTDPSYAGQIMCFTAAQIGNTGCNSLDCESDRIHTMGIVVKNYCRAHSNYRAECSLEDYLKKSSVPGITNVDTRSIVQHLRNHGAQMAAIATGETFDIPALVLKAKSAGSMEGKNYVQAVSCTKKYDWFQLPWDVSTNTYPEIPEKDREKLPVIVALDFGIKYNILRILASKGFRVVVVPAYSSTDEILSHQPKGVFLSNGPGDPATLQEIVQVTKELLGKLPIFGICLGHQIICQALGGKTYKLKFGHRGGNHPVLQTESKQVEITSQNHGFAVDPKSFSQKVNISHLNLNDHTVEGLIDEQLKVFSVQYHPEASPGPHDSVYLFDKFYQLIQDNA